MGALRVIQESPSVRVVHGSRLVTLVGRLDGSTRSRGIPIVVMGVFPYVLTIGLISFFG